MPSCGSQQINLVVTTNKLKLCNIPLKDKHTLQNFASATAG